MASKKQIDVLIDTDGKVKITTSGYKGAECLKATEALEKALGTKTSDQPTAEMKQSEARHNVDIGR